MIIYSVEISLEETVIEEWLQWMQSKHIPDVMNTNLFNQFTIFQNLDIENTYTIQYELNTMEQYEQYEQYFAPNLQKEHTAKFKGKFKAQRTLLKTY